jgi:hypothetical protein
MFNAIMTFPANYPDMPPKLKFTTPGMHNSIQKLSSFYLFMFGLLLRSLIFFGFFPVFMTSLVRR